MSRFHDVCPDCRCPRGPQAITHKLKEDGVISCTVCGSICPSKVTFGTVRQ